MDAGQHLGGMLLALWIALGAAVPAQAHGGSPLMQMMDRTGADPLPVLLSSDCGTEIDDQWAVLYLAISPEVRMLGYVGNHARNGLTAAKARDTILDALENRLGSRDHPPVLAGADGPLPSPEEPRGTEGARCLVEQSRAFTPTDRLNVLVIGSHTDVASAILLDPSIVTRIRVVMMGFRDWPAGGDDWNVQNDPEAARIVFRSGVPLVVGCGAVALRHLSFTTEEAQALLRDTGPAGAWLAECFAAWPERLGEGGRRVWPIWDVVTVAHLLGYTRAMPYHRPLIGPDLAFDHSAPQGQLSWIEWVDEGRVWPDFAAKLRARAGGA